VQTLVDQFREEKMPKRYSTRLAYESWFRNHILLEWGNRCITDLQARPVELWLDGLNLSPKSRVHLSQLVGRSRHRNRCSAKVVITDEMAQAHTKVVGLALNGAQTERKAS
jgi:hypothetical protein